MRGEKGGEAAQGKARQGKAFEENGGFLLFVRCTTPVLFFLPCCCCCSVTDAVAVAVADAATDAVAVAADVAVALVAVISFGAVYAYIGAPHPSPTACDQLLSIRQPKRGAIYKHSNTAHGDTGQHDSLCVPFRASDDHTGHAAVACAPYKQGTTSSRENGK